MQEKNVEKQIGILATLIFILIILICGIKNESDNTLTIGIFYGSNWDVPGSEYQKIIDAAIEKFREKYPDTKVKYIEGVPEGDYSEWLSEMIVKGEAPDVYFVKQDDLYTLASIDALKNLDSKILLDNNFDPDDFYQSAYNDGEVLDHQYALPFECNTRLMFVNKTLLKKNGFKIPEDTWSWEDFYQICGNITRDTDGDNVLDQYGYCDYSLEDAIIANDGMLIKDNKPNILDEKITQTLEYMKKLEGIYGNYTVNAQQFDLGNVAFRPLSLAEYRTYMPYPWSIKKYSSFEWTCVPMPAGYSGGNNAALETLMVGMSNRTTKVERAWEFMKILTVDEEIQSLIYEHASGASPIKAVTKSKETLTLLNEDTPGESVIDMSLLDRTLENAVSFRKDFDAKEDVIEKIEDKLINYLESGNSSSVELYNINEEIRDLLK